MQGLRTDRTASVAIRGHAFMQNVRRGRYELGAEARHDRLRVAAAFDELAEVIRPDTDTSHVSRANRLTNTTVPPRPQPSKLRQSIDQRKGAFSLSIMSNGQRASPG